MEVHIRPTNLEGRLGLLLYGRALAEELSVPDSLPDAGAVLHWSWGQYALALLKLLRICSNVRALERGFVAKRQMRSRWAKLGPVLGTQVNPPGPCLQEALLGPYVAADLGTAQHSDAK